MAKSESPAPLLLAALKDRWATALELSASTGIQHYTVRAVLETLQYGGAVQSRIRRTGKRGRQALEWALVLA